MIQLLSTLEKGQKFVFGSDNSNTVNTFDSNYDDVMSGVLKYLDGMGFEMTASKDLLVKILN